MSADLCVDYIYFDLVSEMKELDQIISTFNELNSSKFFLQLIQFLIWTLFIILLTWLIRKGINRTIESNAARYRAKKTVRLIRISLIALLAVITFTGKVQYFSIAFGIMTAGLAFALQEVILSAAGWIAIFSVKIFKPGDRIEINGVKGDVIDIGITKTTLMEVGEWIQSDNYSGRIVQVSNSFVFKGNVYNYSSDFPFVWDEIILPIHYGSDLEYANSIILNAAEKNLSSYANFAKDHWKSMVKKYLIENANIEPSLSLKLTDNWAEFNLRYVVDYKGRRRTKDLLYKEIRNAIHASNDKVSLASATIEITSVPVIRTQ